MAHTVELLPDGRMDDAVRQLWARLAASGLPSLAHHVHPTNRPHLTLTVTDELDEAARGRLGNVFGALPLPARLESLAAFPGRGGVLYWSVAPTTGLLALHERVLEAIAVVPASDVGAPWTPHCTLARRLTPSSSAPHWRSWPAGRR